MKFHRITASHLKVEDGTWRHAESEEGIRVGFLINAFYDQFLKGYLYISSPKPTFNPLLGEMFKCGKNPKEVYRSLGKLSRHFIISPKFKEILEEYNLSDHVYFEDVTIRRDKQEILKYYYLSFYKSMWDNVVIEKSVFAEYDDNYNDIMDEFYRFNTMEEYDNMRKIKRISPIILKIKDLDKYDFFAFFNYSEDLDFIISERLALRMKKEKITGADIPEYAGKELVAF